MRVFLLGSLADSLVNFRGPLVRRFAAAGHSVVCCAPGMTRNIAGQLAQLGAEAISVPLDRTGLNPIQDLRSALAIRKVLRRTRADLLFSYTVKPVIWGSIAARSACVPRIVSMITGLGYSFGTTEGTRQFVTKTVVNLLYRMSLKFNQKIFFQNTDDLRVFVNRKILSSAERAIVVNGSGVDLARFPYSPSTPGPPVFLMVARLLREKGVIEYVEAARIARRRYPEAIFRLIGPHDSNPSSIPLSLVLEWKREGVIDYCGPAEDVLPHLRRCSVYVLPSYREGMSRSILEAMAVGRPVLTTDVPGCRETVVDGHNGYTVPPRNPEALANKIAVMIENINSLETMGKNSRDMIEDRFDADRIAEFIVSTVENL